MDEILRSWIGEVSFFLSFLLSSVDPRGICRVMRVTRRSWKATVPRCWRIVILLCAGRHFLLPSWATSGKKEHGQSGARFVSTVSDSRRRSAPWKLNAPRSRFYLFPFPLSFLLFFFRIEYSRLGISKKKRGEIAYVASKSSSLLFFSLSSTLRLIRDEFFKKHISRHMYRATHRFSLFILNYALHFIYIHLFFLLVYQKETTIDLYLSVTLQSCFNSSSRKISKIDASNNVDNWK